MRLRIVSSLALLVLSLVSIPATASEAAGSKTPAAPPVQISEILGTLGSEIQELPQELRRFAETLLADGDDGERQRALEAFIDSPSTAVSRFLSALLSLDPSSEVRLEIVHYLGRNPYPQARPLLERLAKWDPDATVAVAALEAMRALAIFELREILTSRMERLSGDRGPAFEIFLEADERWNSLIKGTMLPAFLRAPPPVFSVHDGSYPIRVVALGDFGTGGESQMRVAEAMLGFHDQARFDFGLTLGDNFYDDGMTSPSDPRWKAFWHDLYDPLAVDFYATLGNHDYHEYDSPAAEILYAARDTNWHMPAAYYTFTAGPVQFFALDTNEISEKQIIWLDRELAASQAEWKIVYGHHPIYSDGRHGDSPDLIRRLLPLLRNRVDMYLAAHEHDLQHLKPEAGVHFFISGGGGRHLREPRPGDRSLFARAAHAFTVLEIEPAEIRVIFIGADSSRLYEYTVRK